MGPSDTGGVKTQRRVLVVEDEPSASQILVSMLEAQGSPVIQTLERTGSSREARIASRPS